MLRGLDLFENSVDKDASNNLIPHFNASFFSIQETHTAKISKVLSRLKLWRGSPFSFRRGTLNEKAMFLSSFLVSMGLRHLRNLGSTFQAHVSGMSVEVVSESLDVKQKNHQSTSVRIESTRFFRLKNSLIADCHSFTTPQFRFTGD